jgi:hypothetical protein
MKTFAVMTGLRVSNIIIAEDESVGEELGVTLIEYTQENPAGIGYTWDGEKFNPPVIEEPVDGV